MVARVHPWTNGINVWTIKGWWWSAGDNTTLGISHRNTCKEPVATDDEAKARCKAYIQECLQKAKAAITDPVQSPTQD